MKHLFKLMALVLTLSMGLMACESDEELDGGTVPQADTTPQDQAPIGPCWSAPDDGDCQYECWYDPNCKLLSGQQLLDMGFDPGTSDGTCDWNTGICEAAYKCQLAGYDYETATNDGVVVVKPCPNDLDCISSQTFPCGSDSHCDSWCPCDVDPDCVVGGDCCTPVG